MIQIHLLDEANHSGAGETLAAAFVGYPMMHFFYGPDHAEYVQRMFRMSCAARPKLGNRSLVATDEGQVVGVALLEWPNEPKWTPEMDDEWDEFSKTHPDFSESRFEAYQTLKKELRPESEHVYLAALGFHPERQKTGVGRALLKAIAEMAAPMPVWLDTQLEGNVRLYERNGYQVRAHRDLQGVPFWMLEAPV